MAYHNTSPRHSAAALGCACGKVGTLCSRGGLSGADECCPKCSIDVTEGYKQHQMLPPAQASSQLIHPFSHSTPSLPTLHHPAPGPEPTFISSADAMAAAHFSLEEQRQAEAVRALKPVNPLMGYHASFDAGALAGRRKSNGDIDMDIPEWRGAWGPESRAPATRGHQHARGRGMKRGQENEFDDSDAFDEGDATDTDEPESAPSRFRTGPTPSASFHSQSSASSSSASTMLHPLAASSATNAQNLHSPVPIDPWCGAGWGGKKREPLRPTKSLPMRAGAGHGWGMGMGMVSGGGGRMDGVEETLEDGFDVAQWAAREDF